MTTGPDLISSFNIIKNVPNGAVMQQTDNNMFWYMQKNKQTNIKEISTK